MTLLVTFDEMECFNCGNNYVCMDEEYTAFGLCLNCGAMIKVIRGTHCDCEVMTLPENKELDELVYCDMCQSNLFSPIWR